MQGAVQIDPIFNGISQCIHPGQVFRKRLLIVCSGQQFGHHGVKMRAAAVAISKQDVFSLGPIQHPASLFRTWAMETLCPDSKAVWPSLFPATYRPGS